ncbi:hypothetical protein ATO12_24730 [Aquimarina atlantica]|uniref:HTH araC/xylS-type domain-containing protein n=1 Tax=Aquimarina atlantica TaxID=1317122 RepID=A0A023BR29_9FLAO|nr:AraC family transcriptional regulator [Aquimarina atlantica]EZH72143.1 hypothetical protein ATO12_24730 [Aquimarina atlantica]
MLLLIDGKEKGFSMLFKYRCFSMFNEIKEQKLLSFLFFLIFCSSVYPQLTIRDEIPDSILNKSYREITNLLVKSSGDSIKKILYSNALLEKSKKEHNKLEKAKAYRLMSFNYMDSLSYRIAYLDSSITASKNSTDKNYPAITYLNLAAVYKRQGDSDKTLQSYLKAIEYCEKFDNQRLYYSTQNNIALLKRTIGEDEQAAEIFRKVLSYQETIRKRDKYANKSYLFSILNFANTLRSLKMYDSVSFYNKKGILLSREENIRIYNFFVLNEGINLYYKGRYYEALDSIKKATPYVANDKKRIEEFLISGYFYQAKIYKEISKEEKFLEYLNKIDSLFEKGRYPTITYQKCYKELVRFYRENGTKNKELIYIKKLLKIDSTLTKNFKSISRQITDDYDTPNLLKAKEELINELREEDHKKKSTSIILIVIICIVLLVSLSVYLRNRKYKRRYKELIKANQPNNQLEGRKNIRRESFSRDIGISKEVIDSILLQLQEFEDNHDYLSTKVTVGYVAKKFKTNSRYISKIVNVYKQKSFTVYINELRINFITEKLKENQKLRNYTLSAIGKEIGFNNAESFSKAFYKINGIYPSYFIKKIQNENEK